VGALRGLDDREQGKSAEPGGWTLAFRFHARDVHLVMGPSVPGTSVPYRVLVNGQPPGDAHGIDVDEAGNGTLVEPRLYHLIRQRGSVIDRTVEIAFHAPGVEAYVFTRLGALPLPERRNMNTRKSRIG